MMKSATRCLAIGLRAGVVICGITIAITKVDQPCPGDSGGPVVLCAGSLD